MGNGVSMSLAPNTMKRSKRAAIRKAQIDYSQKILESFDASKTGTLNREEVHAMCLSIVEDVAPLVGVLDSDIDIVMRVGGTTAKAEITVQEIPDALSAVLALKSENIFIHELFVKYDEDKSGNLPKDQLSNLITELNEGIIPIESDLQFIIKQCDISGDGAIEEAQIKAAIMGWYCLAEDTPMPSSVEEAKSHGYSEEQIAEFLKEAKDAGFNDTQIAEFMKQKGIAATGRESVLSAEIAAANGTAKPASAAVTPSPTTDLGYSDNGELLTGTCDDASRKAPAEAPTDTPAAEAPAEAPAASTEGEAPAEAPVAEAEAPKE